MLTLKEAVRIEAILKEAFVKVYINGSDQYPRVIARGWNRQTSPMEYQRWYRLHNLPIPRR